MVRKLKILADNHQVDKNSRMCWGFSCLIGENVLFDTGESNEVLAFNMDKMGVQADKIKKLVISHDHFDHTGGLEAILKKNPSIEVYLLLDFGSELKKRILSLGARVIDNDKFIEIEEGIYTTGKIEGEYGGESISEQAIVVRGKSGLVIITGCAHPLITDIVETVKKRFPKDKIFMVLGGFHLLEKDIREVEIIAQKMKDLEVGKVGPTHCTGEEAIQIFRKKFGNNFVRIGVGAIIKI
ncbi:MAG: MBL fold metallo-hydrolase [Candidatus Omnitrophica bacterium]|nr:MBL fold metallo-hydrolase [Candidatus Omnitrophota bacterium]MBU1047284.1 MBL fold metallo-hydrolase [Candidatus Omnitrophota bacterium]MBU1631164.1 MBL fold metallo-hydrolase [Candidatus Omnitrophota bacterium]MBU1767629.1 MBL fold metallo-hydrolase [Candidatus Omnitrophota bacterium]MBU1889131.1 MBL fold metallo-hydrolase [Candidatus Omnitrophota bacterium]